ncbi:hypothetical protein EXU57_24290 [Segetibacter sp. 3557_3]|uniref:hypothetical protein n=1 Tax=Segetibacter sp. 3557_3 TaxID=2547429 RepID=UPI001058B616|nr:hypothetical protein [Segetibacter sp. 3557_3]TDH18173.1 hypothetical protein EXU57_24290 [Segetibacter sp. 3557_3]
MITDLLFQLLQDTKIIDKYPTSVIDKIKSEIENDGLFKELDIISKQRNYNPFNVENLVNKVSSSIISLIQKRDELKNLEVTLLNTCTNKLITNSVKEKDIALTDLDNKKRDFLNSNLNKQISVLNNTKNITAAPDSLKKVKDYESSKNTIVTTYIKKVDELQDRYEQLNYVDDSGLNYLNRYVQLKELYWEDFKSFFSFLISLDIGLKTVYSINEGLPNYNKFVLLNDYYKWFKRSLIKLDQLFETDQETTLCLSLAHGGTVNGAGFMARIPFFKRGIKEKKFRFYF